MTSIKFYKLHYFQTILEIQRLENKKVIGLQSNIKEWLADNVSEYEFIGYILYEQSSLKASIPAGTLNFMSDDDATLFKLRWL